VIYRPIRTTQQLLGPGVSSSVPRLDVSHTNRTTNQNVISAQTGNTGNPIETNAVVAPVVETVTAQGCATDTDQLRHTNGTTNQNAISSPTSFIE
jgi:hypothetical protein